MSEENRNGKHSNQPADKQHRVDQESPQPEATLPKPEPSFGILDEGRIWSLPKLRVKAIGQ